MCLCRSYKAVDYLHDAWEHFEGTIGVRTGQADLATAGLLFAVWRPKCEQM